MIFEVILNKLHGKPIPTSPNVHGELQGRLSFPHVCIGSPFKFKQYGQSGAWVSEIYPQLTRVVDDICFIKSVQTDSAIHSVGEQLMHTGHGRPHGPGRRRDEGPLRGPSQRALVRDAAHPGVPLLGSHPEDLAQLLGELRAGSFRHLSAKSSGQASPATTTV